MQVRPMKLIDILRIILGTGDNSSNERLSVAEPTPNKLKHLDYIQSAIARMAQNSFLFKGWAVTLASGLTAFGAVKDKSSLLVISVITSVLFWGMDGYYLWLERGFIDIHKVVVRKKEQDIDFNMAVDKHHAFWRWLLTCLRPHLLMFYGTLIVVIIVGICKLKGGAK